MRRTLIFNARGFCVMLLSMTLAMAIPISTHAAVILQYHHVSDKTPTITSISPSLFEEHLDYLEDNKYTIWSIKQLVKKLRKQAPISDKVVVITFDDAYESIYTEAFPLLKKRNWPFTVFVATQPVAQRVKSFMSWEQLREMQEAGATIANHTTTHAHLVRLKQGESEAAWLARVKAEIENAQHALDEHLGPVPKLIAYPYGEYTSEVSELVARLGYVGFGQQSGAVSARHTLTELPRYPMNNHFGAMEQFRLKVASLPLAAKSVQPDTMLVERQAPESLHITLFPEAIHEHLLSCYFSGAGRVESEVERTEAGIVVSIPKLPELPSGRSRLNCTAPSSLPEMNGRFHWFSYFWMRKKVDGSWYGEY